MLTLIAIWYLITELFKPAWLKDAGDITAQMKRQKKKKKRRFKLSRIS